MQLATCLDLLDRLRSEIRDLHAHSQKLQEENDVLSNVVASSNTGYQAAPPQNFVCSVSSITIGRVSKPLTEKEQKDVDIWSPIGENVQNESGTGCDDPEGTDSIDTERRITAMFADDAESVGSPFRPPDVYTVEDTWICISRLLSQKDEKGGMTQHSGEEMNVADVVDGTISASMQNTTSKDRSACFVLRPNSSFRYGWDACGWVLAVIDALMLPLFVFQWYGLPNLPFPDYSRVTNFYWFFFILISFFTGYNTPEGSCEMRLGRIARNYMRGWFAFDVLTILPSCLELCLSLFAPEGTNTTGLIKVIRLQALACFARALRLRQIKDLPQAFLERSNSEYAVIVVAVVKRVAMILATYHYLACIWFAIGASGKKSWIEAFEKDTGRKFRDTFDAYVVSLHWSLVQLGIGETVVEPKSTVELIFNCFVIVASLMFVSAILSGFTAATTRLHYLDTQRSEQNLALRRYIRHHNISPGLALRVWHCRRKFQQSYQNRVLEKDVVLLASLPRLLLSEVRKEAFCPHLLTHPVFRQISSVHGKSVTQICSTAVAESILQGVEEFLPPGYPITMAVFLLGGSLKQKTDFSDVDILAVRGQWACEIALWAAEPQNAGSVFAAPSGCELILVQGAEFQKICKLSYVHLGFVAIYAKLAVEHFNKTVSPHEASALQASDLDLSREWVVGAISATNTTIPMGAEKRNTFLKRFTMRR